MICLPSTRNVFRGKRRGCQNAELTLTTSMLNILSPGTLYGSAFRGPARVQMRMRVARAWSMQELKRIKLEQQPKKGIQ
jgi:hypothetical protein